ncbi:hypothetical protein MMC18_001096 [Xylographa bjoerkii]|nr:hypothetical protein [Xylographa bjoerkii]
MRIRDLGYLPRELAPGPKNSILDVKGVSVGQRTVHEEHNSVACHKGVTVILPRPVNDIQRPCYAGLHALNGNGELTGSFQINEWGLTNTPIALTNSLSLGVAFSAQWQGLIRRARSHGQDDLVLSRNYGTPVVAETADWLLNEIEHTVLEPQHVFQAFDATATQTEVLEGAHGGGAGMTCHGFVGGVRTSSRVVKAEGKEEGYTVGVMVQTNYGYLKDLRIGGVPIGKLLLAEGWKDGVSRTGEEMKGKGRAEDGSIVIVIITDAPLLPTQLQCLAQRAMLGLVQTGNHPSEQVVGEFGTAAVQTYPVEAVRNESINALFRATAEATEEAILNSLMGSRDGLTGRMKVDGLPVERVRELLAKHLVVV